MDLLSQSISTAVMLPRSVKKGVAMLLDAALCAVSVWLAYYLRLGVWMNPIANCGVAILGSVAIAVPMFVAWGLYRTVFRFVGWEALVEIVKALLLYGVTYSAIFTLWGVPGVPRTIGIIQPALLLIGMCGLRAVGRYWLGGRYRHRVRAGKRNVVVYGAGSAGRQLASALNDSGVLRVVGFLDDDRHLQGSAVVGFPVWAPETLTTLVEERHVVEVLLAIPSASRSRRNEVLEMIRAAEVAVRTLPGLMDIAHGKVMTSDLRPPEVDDLLGREPVRADTALAQASIQGRVVMVTGAGGSIGSELCRQIALLEPSKLLLLDASEFSLYSIHRELDWLDDGAPEGEPRIIPLLGSVCDKVRMRSIYSAWRPDVVFHAAAYKHVPLVEHNVIEGARNNVLGTLTCASLAREFEVASFVLVSTDKAVRPTNVMGATKRMAELVLQALAASPTRTCFSMVRFGNVLGSSGSVVPLFRQQIAVGGPVTVTHADVTRYFMTIPEAVQLVLQAGVMATGGEVFVLDMGEPVRVVDLATRMIELSGLKVRSDRQPDGDIDIVFSGLRPGEKLYEELLIGNNPAPTAHPRILTANEQFIAEAELTVALDAFRELVARYDIAAVREWLTAMVDGFVPSTENVDWTFDQARLSAPSAIKSGPSMASVT